VVLHSCPTRRSSDLIGVRLAGLRIKGVPTAMAGPSLWAARFRGKLNGLIKAQGPMGTRVVMPVEVWARALISRGMVAPETRVVSVAAGRAVSVGAVTSLVAAVGCVPGPLSRGY